MNKRRSSGIVMRDIDLKLFYYLYAYKVATSNQIVRDIFKNISHQALYKRLNKFIHQGYLQASYVKEIRGKLIYSLTAKTFQEYVSDNDKTRCQLKSENIWHDLALLDLGEIFKTLPGLQLYVTENILRSSVELIEFENLKMIQRLHPDALLQIKLHGKEFIFAIEYERSLKFHKRYRPFFDKYYSTSEVDAVLLITKDEYLTKRLMDKERLLFGNSDSKIFYCTLENVQSAKSKLMFTNRKMEKLIIPKLVASDDVLATATLSLSVHND
ncbi:MAG: hypothetical protein A2417_15125 [Bdellovibrionales bacterium RIFOXYC1_FULL_37_79]|nr:MAG: hypothetical protein A2417_15125 [Bdellovibrionales bacterium RIFOXYC1_FULL_37_79]